MKKIVADEIIEVLEQAGVKNCYGIVGDTLNYVATKLAKSSIEWVHMRHEEAGAFAAGAEAFLTHRLTACAGSCGPGSLHFINGLFEANRNRAPVILLASQIVTSQLGTSYPQEVDFKALYKDCSVFCEQIQSPDQARRIMVMACQAAISQRGVAVVIIPSDISEAEVNVGLPFSVHCSSPDIYPNPNELAQISTLLNEGKQVGIYVGAGCEGAHDELIALAQKMKAPIVHSSRSKDFIEYDNPYNLGMTGMFGNKASFYMMESCDTLLILGADLAWADFYPQKAKIIQVDINGSHLGRRHPITLGFVGGVRETAKALLPLVNEKTDTHFLDTCLEKHKKALEHREKEEQATADLIHPQYLMHLLSKYATDDAAFTADCGSAMVWLSRHIQVNGKRRTLTSLLHGTMANAMPQALGIQKAFPGRQVISISGDGGLAMLLGDLITIRQEKLPIKIVILNNHSLNFVQLEQKTEGLLDVYTDLNNPNFAGIAEAIGFYGQTVTEGKDLEQAVKNFLDHDGPALLDVHTNAEELIVPPKITADAVLHTSLYGIKAVLNGRSKDVKDLLVNNFLK